MLIGNDVLTNAGQLTRLAPKASWALITGASDGIGKEYALQLARQGYHVLLVSRTQAKLDALATEIQQRCRVQTRTLAMDFAANLEADYTRLRTAIHDLDIGILINNVGLSHSIPVPFAETPPAELAGIITVNCTATLRVTQLVLPGMQQRRRGLILTMASFGGLLPTPLLATYSGSKAFLQQWSSALAAEAAPAGIHVQLVQSYLVTSAMSKIRRSSALIPTPAQFVRAALGKIGRSGGAQGIAATSTPYWAHGLMHWALDTLTPGRMNRYVIGVNKGMHEDIRRRALRKAEREGKRA